MKTRWRIVDAKGDEIGGEFFKPWIDIPVRIQSITYWPDNSPGGEDEIVVTARYLHDKSDEELEL